MKAADEREIFGLPVKNAVSMEFRQAERGNGDDTLWDDGAFEVPVDNSALDANTALDAFDCAEQPVQKTRQEVQNEGIDRSPMLSVAAIRQKFTKSSGPLFPRQIFLARPKSGPQTKSQDSASPQEVEEQTFDEEASMNVPQETETALPPIKSVSSPRRNTITSSEFMEMAKLHGCENGVARFSRPVTVEILIKPELSLTSRDPPKLLVKKMMLQFNPDQRLLVMLRQGTLRYIRLNDVVKIDGSDQCLAFLGSLRDALPPPIQRGFPVALYFTTTRHPMVIALSANEEKDALFKLVIFLRQLLRTASPLEIVA